MNLPFTRDVAPTPSSPMLMVLSPDPAICLKCLHEADRITEGIVAIVANTGIAPLCQPHLDWLSALEEDAPSFDQDEARATWQERADAFRRPGA